MNFEVVQLCLTCACVNYSAHKVSLLYRGSGGWGLGPFLGGKILDFRPSEVVSEFLSNMAETCCELALGKRKGFHGMMRLARKTRKRCYS